MLDKILAAVKLNAESKVIFMQAGFRFTDLHSTAPQGKNLL